MPQCPHLSGCGSRRQRLRSQCALFEPARGWRIAFPICAIVLLLELLTPATGLSGESVANNRRAVDELPPAGANKQNVKRGRVQQAQAVTVQERSATDDESPVDENKSPINADELIGITPPAADPAWPTWSAANDAAKQPIFAPAGYYDLVRPPRGLSPGEEGQEYQRAVATEDDLWYHQATCLPPIDLARPDGFAPAGVFGDHTLNTGGRILLSHRFTDQQFDGMRDGTHSVSTASVLGSFPLAPTSMTSQEHFFLFEYGPTDDLTFQFILPIVLFKIDYIDRFGHRSFTDTTDLYDLQFNTMYVLWRGERQQLHLNAGLRAPTGVFDGLNQFPTPNSPNLTYPMRTSDGTWDLLPGLTYRGQSDDWTWGVQALSTVRLGINRYGYRLGDDGTFNAWGARKLTDWVSLSTRLNGQVWGNIYGADQRLNADLVPTNRTNLQGGQRLDILFGLNFVIPDGVLHGQRFGIEGGLPIYQNLYGPQLQQSYQLWTGLNIIF